MIIAQKQCSHYFRTNRRVVRRGVIVGFAALGFRQQLQTIRCDAFASQNRRLGNVAADLSKAKRVIVMVGAGASVSAGIPDFRTPGIGLYDNLQKYGLPYPEAIFDIDFFRSNPRPFHLLCKELWPGKYKPTDAHYFMTLLHEKGKLQRCFTQNIDSLETQAGLPADMVVAAHGNFDSASCLQPRGRRAKVPIDEVREAILAGEDACVALDKKYGGQVKPDIVFFGENLPRRFFTLSASDFPACDLLIVMGTSLAVQPFAGLVRQVHVHVPRLLINRERVGEDFLSSFERYLEPAALSRGFDFDNFDGRDTFLQGDCDAGVAELVRELGWEADFERLKQRLKQDGGNPQE
eukprot:TRINITY_DN64697_c0_g1_i1.p1 TRINITY_DN64697_c0_g1~~TRINITY_DN64697_c0_g1_i1.p1  ORF type:complete len:350 (-),score=62.00 TRINITY_DN64697_c0_g1_i1:145-1194(-)